MINWQYETDGYNRAHGTRYTIKQLLTKAYRDHYTALGAATWLGISDRTFLKYAHMYGVKLQQGTGGHPGKHMKLMAEKIKEIPDSEMVKMTPKEIREAIGCRSKAHLYTLLSRYGRRYKRWSRVDETSGGKVTDLHTGAGGA